MRDLADVFPAVFLKWFENDNQLGEKTWKPDNACHDWQIRKIEEEEHERDCKPEESRGKNYQGCADGDFLSPWRHFFAVVKSLNTQMLNYEGVQVEDDHK